MVIDTATVEHPRRYISTKLDDALERVVNGTAAAIKVAQFAAAPVDEVTRPGPTRHRLGVRLVPHPDAHHGLATQWRSTFGQEHPGRPVDPDARHCESHAASRGDFRGLHRYAAQ